MLKLLNVVLKKDIVSCEGISGGRVWYTRRGDTLSSFVRVNKLQDRCKKWTSKHGVNIFSTMTDDGGMAMVDPEADVFIPTEVKSSEYEAVYAVCFGVIEFIDRMEK